MRLLVLNVDYSDFLRWLYAQHPALEKQPYAEQMRARMESLFGVTDFYSSNLHKLGHEAWDIHVNNEFMQKAWAQDHSIQLSPDWSWRFRLRRGVVPWVSRVCNPKWMYEVLSAQIKHYKPDVLYNQAMGAIATSFLREMKSHIRLLVGEGEPPVLLQEGDWRGYDLVVAPSEGMVSHFRKMGIKAELLRFGFGSRVLSLLRRDSKKGIPVSFIGSLGRIHSKRCELFEVLCAKINNDIFIWAPRVDDLPAASRIRQRYQGPAWGLDLYRILSISKITLNHHIDIAGQFADNMRLYEATGVGTLLITDYKDNLHTLFEPGKEVVAYTSAEECAELIKYYLEHDDERDDIARAGQKRTLRDHTYYQRMQELVEIVNKHI